MANPDRPRGYRPVKTESGVDYAGYIQTIYAPAADRSSDSTNNHGDIYIGTPISISTSGVVTPADSNEVVSHVAVGFGHSTGINFGANGASQVDPAPAFDPSNLTKRYLAYDESGWIYAVPVKDVLFEVQSASDLDLEVGSLADSNMAAATAHGSRTTGYSNAELTTASDNDVKVVEIVMAPDNDPTLANCRYLVKFMIQNFVANNAT